MTSGIMFDDFAQAIIHQINNGNICDISAPFNRKVCPFQSKFGSVFGLHAWGRWCTFVAILNWYQNWPHRGETVEFHATQISSNTWDVCNFFQANFSTLNKLFQKELQAKSSRIFPVFSFSFVIFLYIFPSLVHSLHFLFSDEFQNDLLFWHSENKRRYVTHSKTGLQCYAVMLVRHSLLRSAGSLAEVWEN